MKVLNLDLESTKPSNGPGQQKLQRVGAEGYLKVRQQTLSICDDLSVEDYVVQPADFVSPPKWHLAHTTWFFEQFLLQKFLPGYKVFDPDYGRLFNSYYKTVGSHWLQSERGHLSRPGISEIKSYRHYVDENFARLVEKRRLSSDEFDFITRVGVEHEKQHQELLLMDIKFIFASNPRKVVFCSSSIDSKEALEAAWIEFNNEAIAEVGHLGDDFCYDNEKPCHWQFFYPFKIRKGLVTNSEFLEFILDGGYARPELWLSMGWDWVKSKKVTSPLYWYPSESGWMEYTMHGGLPIILNAPVSHISFYEADAFARWKKCRLPTEGESELYLQNQGAEKVHDLNSSFATGTFHPVKPNSPSGQVWWWTSSQYRPYPKFEAFENELGEYNGKFMCNQFVLKGGSWATPPDHFRNSYRNFYEPQQRWMVSGLRLAKDI